MKISSQKIISYLIAMRFDKPIGIYLLLWPTLSALWLAMYQLPHPSVIASTAEQSALNLIILTQIPSIKLLIIFILGTITMRAAGCLINDYADRNFDKHVERTKNRPFTSGQIKPTEILISLVILCLIAFFFVLQLNIKTIGLSFIALFLASFYPFSKRFFPIPQLFLGLAYGFAIPMAFAATLNKIPLTAWLFYAATVIWSMIYDTYYAMVDKTDDIKLGLHTSAIFFGKHTRMIIGILQVLMLVLLIIIGFIENLGNYYFLSVNIAVLLFIHQQWQIRDEQPNACFKAFLQSHWVGLVILLGVISHCVV